MIKRVICPSGQSVKVGRGIKVIHCTCERANTNKWSKDIKKRRLKWLGHLLRLPEDTPARQAFQEAFRPVNRPRGRPKTTWISLVTKELKEMNIELTYDSLHEVVELANDRNAWRNLVGRAMSK